jgi:hypothetical protein
MTSFPLLPATFNAFNSLYRSALDRLDRRLVKRRFEPAESRMILHPELLERAVEKAPPRTLRKAA